MDIEHVNLTVPRDRDKAETLLREAIKLDPTFTEAYSRRSKAWAASGDRDKANADYDEALRLGTIQSGGLHRSRGLAFESKGDHERAIVEFGRAIANYDAALRIFPDDAALLYRRGIVKLDAGDDIGGNADIAAARAIQAGDCRCLR